jgi:hypothetical protein
VPAKLVRFEALRLKSLLAVFRRPARGNPGTRPA